MANLKPEIDKLYFWQSWLGSIRQDKQTKQPSILLVHLSWDILFFLSNNILLDIQIFIYNGIMVLWFYRP